MDRKKLWHAIVLALSTGLLIVPILWMVHVLQQPVQTEWSAPQGVKVKPGPVSFWYDPEQSVLKHHGPLTREIRDELLGLIVVGDGQAGIDARRSYEQAVNRLAFLSTGRQDLWWLLFLGGLGGMLGTQLRSIWLFVDVACYRKTYDLNRWWPWYFMRPVLGFGLGFILVVLSQAGLYAAPDQPAEAIDVWWWLGLSFLVGFVALDFVERLEKVAKTAFGIEETEEKEEEIAEKKEETEET